MFPIDFGKYTIYILVYERVATLTTNKSSFFFFLNNRSFIFHSLSEICIVIPFCQVSQPEGSGEIVGRGVYRSYYKGHKDKIKGEGRGGGGRWDWLGWGGGMGRKGCN